MSSEILPSLPRSYKVSELLSGDSSGFIINAYLALQRQWPDKGGYQHYLYVLSVHPEQRPTVLQEIAASPAARRHGIELIDDLQEAEPPAGDAEQQYIRQCVNLRIPHLAHAIDELNAQDAVAGVNEEVTRLQQRIDEQGKEIANLRRELRNMAARLGIGTVTLVANPVSQEGAAPAFLVNEVEQLKATVEPLHHFATVELKRLIADYTNALITAHLDAVR